MIPSAAGDSHGIGCKCIIIRAVVDITRCWLAAKSVCVSRIVCNCRVHDVSERAIVQAASLAAAQVIRPGLQVLCHGHLRIACGTFPVAAEFVGAALLRAVAELAVLLGIVGRAGVVVA